MRAVAITQGPSPAAIHDLASKDFMSFIPFQQHCLECHAKWNTMFGVIGTSLLGPPCEECPHCHSKNIAYHADGWADPPREISHDQLWGEYT